MPLNGHVYQVTNATECFGGILLGAPDTPPTDGFEPWEGVQVTLALESNVGGLLGWILLFADLWGDQSRTLTTAADGSFSFADPSPEQLDEIAAWAGIPGGEALSVQIWVSQGTFPFQVIYRSDLSLTLDDADGKQLDIWLLPYSLPKGGGITAGMVSGVMTGTGLPGNTSITASPAGLSFSGSHKGADIQFGIGVLPDTSSDLDSFFDLSLLSWNIHVGWPADWCTTADDILGQIKSGVQNAGTGVNKTVTLMIQNTLAAAYPLIPVNNISNFTEKDISVTFNDVAYIPYTWAASDTKDSTIVLVAQPVIGWPRSLSSDPTKSAAYPQPRRKLPRFNPVPVHPIFGLASQG
jgi:hypothetical protein